MSRMTIAVFCLTSDVAFTFGLCVRIRNFEDLTGFLQQGGLG